ncbi:MAG: dihydrofolate reductase family protein [Pseudoxanthomonas sp.]
MRKLTVAAFLSLDGVIQGPGGPGEDIEGGFAYCGWMVPYADEAFGAEIDELFARPFDLLLGRKTYDIFACYWPNAKVEGQDSKIADLFNNATKHVATHRPETLAWQNSRALGQDVVEALRALKRTDGPDLLTQGSSDLVHQLLAADLVDELRLMVFRVVLGKGKRLFDAGSRAAAFRLESSSVTPGGIVISRYAREGEVRTGSFATA